MLVFDVAHVSLFHSLIFLLWSNDAPLSHSNSHSPLPRPHADIDDVISCFVWRLLYKCHQSRDLDHFLSDLTLTTTSLTTSHIRRVTCDLCHLALTSLLWHLIHLLWRHRLTSESVRTWTFPATQSSEIISQNLCCDLDHKYVVANSSLLDLSVFVDSVIISTPAKSWSTDQEGQLVIGVSSVFCETRTSRWPSRAVSRHHRHPPPTAAPELLLLLLTHAQWHCRASPDSHIGQGVMSREHLITFELTFYSWITRGLYSEISHRTVLWHDAVFK